MNGVEKSGSIAKNAGFNIQQYSALIGATAEITRASGEEVGNAWKTILARMSKVALKTKKGITTINDLDKALRGVGLTVKDQNGDLKESTTILDEIAQKWNSGMLTNMQKQEIAFKAVTKSL